MEVRNKIKRRSSMYSNHTSKGNLVLNLDDDLSRKLTRLKINTLPTKAYATSLYPRGPRLLQREKVCGESLLKIALAAIIQ